MTNTTQPGKELDGGGCVSGNQQASNPDEACETNKVAEEEGRREQNGTTINNNFTEVRLNEPPARGNEKNDEQNKPSDQVNETVPRPTVDKTPTNVGNTRHLVALLALSSIILANANRQAFNQALVYMIRVNESPLQLPAAAAAAADEAANTTETTTISETEAYQLAEQPDDRYDWSGQQKSLLQAAFSYGYMPFMVAGGRMSEIYGAKWVVFLSGFGSALCSLATPLLADSNFALLVASRVLMGISQTGVSPALYALLTRWLPPEESSVYLPMIKTGVMFGFMSGSLVNSFMTWRLTFYVVGIVGMLWSLLWAIFVTSTPQEHRFMSQSEKDYLGVRLNQPAGSGHLHQKKKKPKSAPWLRIITNPVVLAFMFTKLTVKLSTDAQSMQLPMYLDNVFHVSKEINGLLNAINFAIQAISTGFVAYLAKEMISKSTFGLSKTGIRRLSQAINNFGMASFYIFMTFNMGSFWMVACCVIGLAVCSIFGAGGEAVLPIDLTNEYSASIMAIANTMANLSGIILPPIVTLLLADNNTDPIRWNCVWLLVAGVMILGGFAFCFFVEAEVQDFDEEQPPEKRTKKKRLLCDQCKMQIISGSQQTAIEMSERSKSNQEDP